MKTNLLKSTAFTLCLVPLLIGCGGGGGGGTSTTNSTPVVAAASSASTITTSSSSYNIVDTSQTTCYNSAGTAVSCTSAGQDGSYTRNAASFTSSTSVVTDNITSLMWQYSADINGDSTINASDKRSQSDALTYCNNLSLGGYTNWRLPDIKTLYSLMDFRGLDPSSVTSTDTSSLIPFIDRNFFDFAYGDTSSGERIIDSQWATTSTYVSTVMGGQAAMFGLNLADGRIKAYPTSSKTFYVKCVRNNINYGKNNYTDNGDDTISDSATNLMWQKNDYSTAILWDNAITTCENATTAGYTNWRLPNAKELHSIVDYSRSPDTTNSPALNAIFNSTSFTNENSQTDWGSYWSSTTHLKSSGSGDYGVYVSFGRAMGYMSGSWMDVHGAGAQRSDPKTTLNTSSLDPSYQVVGGVITHGPQGDVIRSNNYVRCVRDI